MRAVQKCHYKAGCWLGVGSFEGFEQVGLLGLKTADAGDGLPLIWTWGCWLAQQGKRCVGRERMPGRFELLDFSGKGLSALATP